MEKSSNWVRSKEHSGNISKWKIWSLSACPCINQPSSRVSYRECSSFASWTILCAFPVWHHAADINCLFSIMPLQMCTVLFVNTWITSWRPVWAWSILATFPGFSSVTWSPTEYSWCCHLWFCTMLTTIVKSDRKILKIDWVLLEWVNYELF